MRKHLAENFWAAMVPRGERAPRLRAVVRTHRGREQLGEQLVDPADYVRPMVETIQKHYSEELVETLSEPGDVIATPVSLTVPARFEPDPHPSLDHHATLLVAYTDQLAQDDSVSRVVYLRGNNMTIRDFKLGALPLGARQFHAILLAGEAAGDDPDNRQAEKFLRAAEPPAHNKWTGTTELTTRYARGGASRIGEFERTIKEKIRESVRDRGGGGDDGPEPLKELLRLVMNTENPRKPRVRKVDPVLDLDTGVWTIDAIVSVPGASRWSFSPILMFGTESGPGIKVGWKSVEAVDRCEMIDGRLVTRPGVRTVSFRAVSDPGTYPVKAERARAGLDLRHVRKVQEGVS
jgi:RNA polymerase primary sigma factor